MSEEGRKIKIEILLLRGKNVRLSSELFRVVVFGERECEKQKNIMKIICVLKAREKCNKEEKSEQEGKKI